MDRTAVNRKNADGSLWLPTPNSRICSEHFIGNKKSEHPLHPSFEPTIFPEIYGKKNVVNVSAVARFERSAKRRRLRETEDSQNICPVASTTYPTDIMGATEATEEACSTISPQHQETQVDFLEESTSGFEFSCSHYIFNDCDDAQVQAKIPVNAADVKALESKKKFKNKCCNTGVIRFHDMATGPDVPDKKISLKCVSGFHGWSSISKNQDLLDLAGTSLKSFNLLLQVKKAALNAGGNCSEGPTKRQKFTLEDRLLIFCIKMKSGLSFSALAVLFQSHRSTISRIFYSSLNLLTPACKKFVQWPNRNDAQHMMPPEFKEVYPNCRVVIDCIEFIVQQPHTVEERVQLYSYYKKGFRVKVLVGCTPNGMISFISRCCGGRTTDAQITTNGRFLRLLEPGDVVLADKGFPHIKSVLDENGKGILLVMLFFLHDTQFTAEEVSETYKVEKFRIHVERVMQRIRTYNILNILNTKMLSHSDQIVFITGVRVNL